jgi:hypothetical protein
MHQFWQFSFTTARTWGRGPRIWKASTLRFTEFSNQGPGSVPSTPTANIDSPGQQFRSDRLSNNHPKSSKMQRPTDLCQWSIHARSVSYKKAESPELSEPPEDLGNEDSWKPWTSSHTIHDFAESLQTSLQSNDFSTIDVKQLPISSGQIVKAAERSQEQLLEEAFGFSIMARNTDLIYDMLENTDEDFSLQELFPLHLAASYLDGSKTCCGIFEAIIEGMPTGEASVRKLYMNHLNHTILDNLMITILKTHSSCTPIMVDEAFKTEHRFAGEEVDICGRWDADSNCIRELQASGSPIIPIAWKHMFCHTSAQAITHCIGSLFSPYWGPDIDAPSGLFLKRCQNEACGLKLQLRPLHTLVVTAVYLAQLGRDGETLFGIIACLLCLLGKGANPLLKAHLSLDALLHRRDSQECTHSELDPLELAHNVPEDIISSWPQERITGWRIFGAILNLSQREWTPSAVHELREASEPREGFQSSYGIYTRDIEHYPGMSLPFMDIDLVESRSADEDGGDSSDDGEGLPAFCPEHDHASYQKNYFGKNKYLATLWAAVQTELLTYRRINEGDPWISANFDMESVLESLEMGTDLTINLVSKEMMKPFCRCGVFEMSEDPACVRVEEASAYYFSNLEDWNRSTYIAAPEYRMESWDRG